MIHGQAKLKRTGRSRLIDRDLTAHRQVLQRGQPILEIHLAETVEAQSAHLVVQVNQRQFPGLPVHLPAGRRFGEPETAQKGTVIVTDQRRCQPPGVFLRAGRRPGAQK